MKDCRHGVMNLNYLFNLVKAYKLGMYGADYAWILQETFEQRGIIEIPMNSEKNIKVYLQQGTIIGGGRAWKICRRKPQTAR